MPNRSDAYEHQKVEGNTVGKYGTIANAVIRNKRQPSLLSRILSQCVFTVAAPKGAFFFLSQGSA